MNQIILASKSIFRANLLTNAGVLFETAPANINEREVEEPLLAAEVDAAGIAEILAIAKATSVSEKNTGAVVIGCDQTLSLQGELLHKPEDMDAARRRLLALSGKTHVLNSAVCLVKDNEVLWSLTDPSYVTFRELDPGFIGRHLAEVGEIALSSVGAYQIEGMGVQLFQSIKGDFFSIMGLPLLPLLAELRRRNFLDH